MRGGGSGPPYRVSSLSPVAYHSLLLVGQIASVCEARNGRLTGAGAGGDYGFGKPQRLPIAGDGVRPGEARVAEELIDTQVAEALRRVVRTEVGPQPPHALHHGGKMHPHAGRH